MSMDIEKNFVSVVAYMRDDEPMVVPFLKTVAGWLMRRFESFEIVLVDDGSIDRSVDVALRFGKDLGNSILTVLRMGYKQGKESSLCAGMDLSIGDFVFEFESIEPNCTEEILEKVYAASLGGNDIVAATPSGPAPISNRAFFRLFNQGLASKDPIRSERFRCISRRAINRIGMVSGKVVYRKAVYYNCGLKTVAIPFDLLPFERSTGRDREEEWGLAIDSLIYFTNLGFRISVALSIAMMGFSLCGLFYAIAARLILGHVVEGWLTTMLFLSFAFFGVFTILAIMVKYLSLILESTHRRQPYLFESIQKANEN